MQVKSKQLKAIYFPLAKSLVGRFRRVSFAHVLREHNQEADAAATLAITDNSLRERCCVLFEPTNATVDCKFNSPAVRLGSIRTSISSSGQSLLDSSAIRHDEMDVSIQPPHTIVKGRMMEFTVVGMLPTLAVKVGNYDLVVRDVLVVDNLPVPFHFAGQFGVKGSTDILKGSGDPTSVAVGTTFSGLSVHKHIPAAYQRHPYWNVATKKSGEQCCMQSCSG